MLGIVSFVTIQKTFKAKPVMKQEHSKQDQLSDLKVKIPKDEMERINKNVKLCRALGVPEDEVQKYFYDCIKAYGEIEPVRKPMNGDELLEGFYAAECSGLRSFTEGVRWAEKFHGIGGDDE